MTKQIAPGRGQYERRHWPNATDKPNEDCNCQLLAHSLAVIWPVQRVAGHSSEWLTKLAAIKEIHECM